MLNYRVQHSEALVRQLLANGVTILDGGARSGYGKFVPIMEAEDNKMEREKPS